MLFNIKTDEHFAIKKGDDTLNVDELGDMSQMVTKSELSSYNPIIEDTRSSAVAEITGVAPFSELVDGQRIVLHSEFYYTGAAVFTLNLTLSDGTTTGAKNIKYITTTNSWNNCANTGISGKIQNGVYYQLYFDIAKDAWLMEQDSIQNLYTMTQVEINAGSSTQPRTISPKMLRDNFYIKSEVDGLIPDVSGKADKRVVAYPSKTSDWLFQDMGYVPSQAELNDILVIYLPNWQEDNAVVSVINALLASTDITGVTMSLESFKALSTSVVEFDTWGYNSMAPDNVVTNATLGTNTYIIYGTTDTVAPQLPMVQSTVPGYTGTISGTFNDTDAAIEYFKTLDDNAYDVQVVTELLIDLDTNGGASQSYSLSISAYNALMSTIVWVDESGESVPNFDTTTEAQVTVYAPDYTAADEFLFSFTCASDNCVLTLPNGVAWADGFDFDRDRKAGAKFQVSIMDGIARYLCLTNNNSIPCSAIYYNGQTGNIVTQSDTLDVALKAIDDAIGNVETLLANI